MTTKPAELYVDVFPPSRHHLSPFARSNAPSLVGIPFVSGEPASVALPNDGRFFIQAVDLLDASPETVPVLEQVQICKILWLAAPIPLHRHPEVPGKRHPEDIEVIADSSWTRNARISEARERCILGHPRNGLSTYQQRMEEAIIRREPVSFVVTAQDEILFSIGGPPGSHGLIALRFYPEMVPT